MLPRCRKPCRRWPRSSRRWQRGNGSKSASFFSQVQARETADMFGVEMPTPSNASSARRPSVSTSMSMLLVQSGWSARLLQGSQGQLRAARVVEAHPSLHRCICVAQGLRQLGSRVTFGPFERKRALPMPLGNGQRGRQAWATRGPLGVSPSSRCLACQAKTAQAGPRRLGVVVRR